MSRYEVSQPARSSHSLPWVAGAAAVLAVALGVGAITWRTHDTIESKAYTHEPLYGVWGGLILLQMVVAAALGVASLRWWSELRHLESPPAPQPRGQAIRHWLIASIVLGVALLAPAFAMPNGYPRNYPDHQPLRILALAAYAVAAMGVTAAALVRLGAVAATLPPEAVAAAERFRLLWGRQRQLLGALAAMLAVNVLATAVKYQMNNDFKVPARSTETDLPDLPATYVLTIGVTYGAVILAVYLPVYVTTRQAGDNLATRLAGVASATDGESWFAANADRQRYRTALGVAEGTRENLERAAGILAPLIAALFAAFLPDLKL